MAIKPPRRTSSPIRRRSSRRCALQSLPKCTRVPVAVCQVVCPTWAAPQLVVTHKALLLAVQPLRRSINTKSTPPSQIYSPFTKILYPNHFHVKPCNVVVKISCLFYCPKLYFSHTTSTQTKNTSLIFVQ